MVALVEQVKPVSANGWEEVLTKFNKWAKAEGRPVRDADAFKRKFEKMANPKLESEDPVEDRISKRAKQLSSMLSSQKEPHGQKAASGKATKAVKGVKKSVKKVAGSKGSKKAAAGGEAAPSDASKSKLMTFFQNNLLPALQANQGRTEQELNNFQARLDHQLTTNQSRLEHQITEMRFQLQQQQVHTQVILQQLHTIHAILMMNREAPYQEAQPAQQAAPKKASEKSGSGKGSSKKKV